MGLDGNLGRGCGINWYGRRRRLMAKNEAIDVCIEDLVQAIILQAVLDYAEALEILEREERKTRKSLNAQRMKWDVEKFFHSNWFAMMSDADPKEILGLLKRGEADVASIRARIENTDGGEED